MIGLRLHLSFCSVTDDTILFVNLRLYVHIRFKDLIARLFLASLIFIGLRDA